MRHSAACEEEEEEEEDILIRNERLSIVYFEKLKIQLSLSLSLSFLPPLLCKLCVNHLPSP